MKISIRRFRTILFIITEILGIAEICSTIFIGVAINKYEIYLDNTVLQGQAVKNLKLAVTLNSVCSIALIIFLLVSIIILSRNVLKQIINISDTYKNNQPIVGNDILELNSMVNSYNSTTKTLLIERDLLKKEGLRFRKIVADQADLIVEYYNNTNIMKTVFTSANKIFSDKLCLNNFEDFNKIVEVNYKLIFSQNLNNCIETKKRQEFELLIKDGKDEYIWCNIIILYMEEIEDTPEHYIFVITDINNEHETKSDLIAKAQLDPLTGIYNRNTFFEKAENMLKEVTHSTLIIMDCDHFKNVNDSHGHMAGDIALKIIADAMRNTFRSSDVYGRLGGDEFIIWSNSALKRETIINRFEKFNVLIANMCKSQEKLPCITTTWGIAVSYKSCNFNLLYSSADNALYKAKNKKRGTLEITNL